MSSILGIDVGGTFTDFFLWQDADADCPRGEVAERLDFRGNVLRSLDPADVDEMLDRVMEAGAESLAVCFLFSFQNPAHEEMVASAGRGRGLFVSASHAGLPAYPEDGRTRPTAANPQRGAG